MTKTSIYINWFLGGTRGDQLSPTECNGGNQVKLTANQLPMRGRYMTEPYGGGGGEGINLSGLCRETTLKILFLSRKSDEA